MQGNDLTVFFHQYRQPNDKKFLFLIRVIMGNKKGDIQVTRKDIIQSQSNCSVTEVDMRYKGGWLRKDGLMLNSSFRRFAVQTRSSQILVEVCDRSHWTGSLRWHCHPLQQKKGKSLDTYFPVSSNQVKQFFKQICIKHMWRNFWDNHLINVKLSHVTRFEKRESASHTAEYSPKPFQHRDYTQL